MGIVTGELFYDAMDLFCYYFVDEASTHPVLSPPLEDGDACLAYSDDSQQVVEALMKVNADGYVDHSVRVNMGIQEQSAMSTLPFFPSSMLIRERMSRHSQGRVSSPVTSGTDNKASVGSGARQSMQSVQEEVGSDLNDSTI
jgi:hypothetical protein